MGTDSLSEPAASFQKEPLSGYSFPKSARVLKRGVFQKLSFKGRRSAGNLIAIETFFGNGSRAKLGITVSRHYGKAIKRNRFKRIVREAFRLCQHLLPAGLHINVKPRSTKPHAGASAKNKPPSKKPPSPTELASTADILKELQLLLLPSYS